MWQLVYPLSSFLAIFIIESFLEALDYHAVRPLDLTIGPWVCNRDIFDLDACIFIELPELVGREIWSQIHDDGVREAEAMQDIGDEVNDSIGYELGYQLVLDPLGKLVDSHQYMGETAWRRCEGPNHIKAPASKRPGWWYGDETVSWDMRMLAKELAVLASPHEILNIGHCGGPPQIFSVCFPHQHF
jgi:hypothetical protein